MAELGSTNINGDLKTTGDHLVGENNTVEGDSETKGILTEQGERVFSPNNRNVSDSVTSSSSTTFASSKSVKTAQDKGVEALNKANTKLGATSKAVDSDKLDGLNSSQFVRSDISPTINAGTNTTLTVKAGDSGSAQIRALGTSQGTGIIYAGQDSSYGGGFGYDGDNTPDWVGASDRVSFYRRTGGTDTVVFDYSHANSTVDFKVNPTVGANEIWHAGNDGSGSGLDADKLDGQHGSYYAKASQVLTNVPAGAKFTDTNTQRSVSDSVTSTSTSVAASSKAAKTAYDKGVQALNAANTKLDDNGQLAGENGYEYWRHNYRVSTTSFKPLLSRSGGALSVNGFYRVYAHVQGTGTKNGAVAVFWYEGDTWKYNVTSTAGNTNNVPEFIISDGLPALRTRHANNYDINVYHEHYHGSQGTVGNSHRGMIGVDGYLSDIAGSLFFRGTHKVYHAGNDGSGSGLDADLLDGQHGTYYAKASQVLTNVPVGAKFTDTNTQRSVSDSVTSTSTSVAASSKAAKTAYDKGNEALAKANTKLAATAKAVDADKLDGLSSASFARLGYTGQPNNYLYVYRNSSATPLYVTQGGSGDIARFLKGASGATDVTIGVTIENDGSLISTAKVQATNHVSINPSNVNASASFNWSNDKPRIRVGGSGAGASSAFAIQSTSDNNMLEVNTSEAYIGISKHKAYHAGNDGAGSGLDADLLDGQHGAYYAKASQVLTNVPTGAKFTDTQRAISDSVTSTATATSASSKAAKTAYDKGVQALNTANGKLGSGSKAVDSDKLDGLNSSDFARQYSWVVGSVGGTRQWLKLFTLGESDASITGMFGSGGDYGSNNRASYQVNIGTRGGNISLRAYSLGRNGQLDAPEFSYKKLANNTFEVWVKLSDYNQRQYFTRHSIFGSVTVHTDSTGNSNDPATVIVPNNEIITSENDNSFVKVNSSKWVGVRDTGGDDVYIFQDDANESMLSYTYGATFRFFGDKAETNSLIRAGGAEFHRKLNALGGVYDNGNRAFSLSNKPTIASISDNAELVKHLAMTPYTTIPSGGWGQKLHYSVMVKSGSSGSPAATGYWNVLGKRDSADGYAGILIGEYQSGGKGVWIGRNELGSANPVFERLWTDKTDGSGSGLDADKLDGLHATQFLRSDASDTFTGTLSLGAGSAIKFDGLTGIQNEDGKNIFWEHGNNNVTVSAGGVDGDLFLGYNTGNHHTNQIRLCRDLVDDATGGLLIQGRALYDNGSRVWSSGNDGSGSGLDADKLDGYQGSDFVRKAEQKFTTQDGWIRENGDNDHVRLYGNTRTVVMRTDGTAQYSGAGAYPFIWLYGGDSASNRLMLLSTSGDIWLKSQNNWMGNILSGKLGTTAQAADSKKLEGRALHTNPTANTVPLRDTSGDINARLFKSNYQNESGLGLSSAIAFRNSTTDNYIRFCTGNASVRNWLNVYSKQEVLNLTGGTWTQVRNGAQAGSFTSSVSLAGKEVCFVSTDNSSTDQINVVKCYIPPISGFASDTNYYAPVGKDHVEYDYTTREVRTYGEYENHQLWYRTPALNDYPPIGTVTHSRIY